MTADNAATLAQGATRGPFTADDAIRDLMRDHTRAELIEFAVAQTQAVVDAERSREQAEAERDEALAALAEWDEWGKGNRPMEHRAFQSMRDRTRKVLRRHDAQPGGGG